MIEENSQYSYQGRIFESKEAMELYIASRSVSAQNYAGLGTKGRNSFPWLYVALGFIGLAMVSCIFNSKSPADTQRSSDTQQPSSGVSENSKTTLATLVNLHGELCAKVTDVTRISGDLYRVNCTRYRDGTGSSVYEVNAANGAVK